jgi:uncharacterized protein (DUF1800 family)
MKEVKTGPRPISVLSTATVWLAVSLVARLAQAQPDSHFYTLPPCRAVDTRDVSLGGPAIGAGQSRTFGFADCGVSPTARAVALNLTVTEATAGGHLTLYPEGSPKPLASSINYRAGQTRANNGIVAVGPGAVLAINGGLPTGSVHVIIDITGYFDNAVNNQPPSVSAGLDETTIIPAFAALNGTASDDGLPNPPNALTFTWSAVSGPGSVAFGYTNAISTNVSFTLPGAYVLRLTADDGAIARSDDLTVTVGAPTGINIARFLSQATWGPTGPLIAHVQSIGIPAWLQEQFNAPITGYPDLPQIWPATAPATCDATCVRDNYSMYPLQRRFFTNALHGEDQLRQRVAWALHQMVVVSGRDITLPSWMTPYLRIFDLHAFGNYKDILYEVTLNPAMGRYLDMTTSTRTNPNENYAREILQLFSIGTDLLNVDGTPQLDASGEPLPSYDQAIVDGFTKVFTGWRIGSTANPNPPPATIPDYRTPMALVANNHSIGDKLLLNGVVLPPCAVAPATNCTAAAANQELDAAITNIFNHANVGPFVSKHLIKNLVTSNPTPAYVARVASVFNNDGTGTRGNLRAVVEAILMDPEARDDGLALSSPNYGHLKEPVLYITNLLRPFDPRSVNGATTSDGYLNPNSVNLDQDVLRPPTVFSYYPADFEAPGAPGVLGPEFGIFSAATALRRANFVNTMLGNMTTVNPPPGGGRITVVGVSTNSPDGTAIDLSSLVPLAASPTALVDNLNQLLHFGAMSAPMHSSIVNAVTAIPAANSLLRVRQAIYLIATSSQYQVQR